MAEPDVEIARIGARVGALEEDRRRQNGALIRLADSHDALARDMRRDMAHLNDKIDALVMRQTERSSDHNEATITRATMALLSVMGVVGGAVSSFILHFLR